ncbi:MAG: hypothetical protein ACI9QL_002080 [Candidatus Omnitrophota bacterium]|jgi:hypothetical protein
MKKINVVAMIALFVLGLAAVVSAEDVSVKINSAYTYKMLDHTTDINRKQLMLLQMREAGELEDKQMYLGAGITVIGDVQDSNTAAKFGYLMRHPTQSNQGGKSASEMVIHNANLQITGTLTPWATMYFQVLYDPEQSFGAGTITSLGRNQLQLRRGYVLLGDLSQLPFYASIGKMATPFGLTDTVNPFSSSTVWHAFGGLAYGGQVGYHHNGLDLAFMGIQGGAQFRATNSGDETPDDVANYAASAAYTLHLAEDTDIRVGGSYVDGSAYCQDFPVTHFDGCDDNNPAWDAYTVMKMGRLKLIAEYAETTDVWPGTHNPNPPLDVFAAEKVSSFDIGVKYQLPVAAIGKDIGVSVDFSKFVAGDEGSPWEDQTQLVFGLELFLNAHTQIFAEYIKTEGYAPLNFISGPDPFDSTKNPGTTHSVSDAESDVVVIGLRTSI